MPRVTVAERHRLILPQRLSVQSLGEDIQKALREGVPTLGWRGDPWLTLAYVKDTDEFEVWDTKPQNRKDSHTLVFKVKRTDVISDPINRILIRLRDSNIERMSVRQYTDMIMSRFDQDDARKDKALLEATEDFSDKAAWAIKKDVGHLY